MPIPDAYDDLVSALIRATERGKLDWTPGPNQWTYLTSFQKFSVKVEDSGQEDVGSQYTVAVLDDEGEEMDSFIVSRGDAGFRQILNLWHAARRRATKVDEALREIQSKLEELSPPEEDENLFE